MGTLLNNDDVRKSFFTLLMELPEFHTNVLHFLADNPHRPIQIAIQHLCENCGPIKEEEKYVLETECGRCGEMRTVEFY